MRLGHHGEIRGKPSEELVRRSGEIHQGFSSLS
jgi:hypothetical protein